MFKNLFALFLTIISSIFGLNKIKNVDLRNQLTPAPTVTETQTVTKTPTTSALVPLPTSEDIIHTFFELINENRVPEAISMLSNNAVPDESSKQGYTKTFSVFSSAKAINIEEWLKEEWTSERRNYKVTFEVKTKPENDLLPIPWSDGLNTRWMTLTKEDGLWQIDGFSTGP